MKSIVFPLLFLTKFLTAVSATKKNLIIDTDLFSDVDDAGALLLAATSPRANLLAVNVNHPSRYSALAASAILAQYGWVDVPVGIIRPLSDATFFDGWYYTLGEYASKVAYHFSGGSLLWDGRAEDAWEPVALHRKVLASAEDGSVTLVSIGFLDNLSALLNSTQDAHSPFTGTQLVSRKVAELVVMGGGYPSGRSWNFWGSGNASLAAHVVRSWPGPVTFLGDDVGKHVLTGGPLMASGKVGGREPLPGDDPVRWAYIWYGYYAPRPSWDPLAVVYAIDGLGGLFKWGNKYGYNEIEADGTNRWVWDPKVTNQHFLRLKVDNETAAAEVDRLFLQGALSGRSGGGGSEEHGPEPAGGPTGHGEL